VSLPGRGAGGEEGANLVATRLLEEGVDIRIVREILAHADINDTMLYTKVANPQIASAMLRLPADWSALPSPPPARPLTSRVMSAAYATHGVGP
jgi:Phage integrase family